MAVMSAYNGKKTLSEDQVAGLIREGWKEVPETFAVQEPGNEVWQWRLFSISIEAGPVTASSRSVPTGGVFFLKRP
jgi:hypothetical protein